MNAGKSHYQILQKPFELGTHSTRHPRQLEIVRISSSHVLQHDLDGIAGALESTCTTVKVHDHLVNTTKEEQSKQSVYVLQSRVKITYGRIEVK